MEDTTKGETPVEETPAPETQEDVANPALDNPRASIYEKYDAMKAEKEAAEAVSAEETPEEAPPDKASATEEKPAAEEEAVPLEQAKEKVKGLKVKVKLDGKEEVLTVDSLLDRSTKEEGRERALQRKAQELAREREAFEHQRAVASQPSPASYEPPTPGEGKTKELRYWTEGEVEAKYNELFDESRYKADQFVKAVERERQRSAEESRKARMDTAERDYFALHPEAEAPIKDFFADTKNFSDPRIASAFERGDYYGALEIANVRIESQAVTREREAIKAAREAELAEEKKKADLKKKGSVIRSSTRQEIKPTEEFRPLTPSEVIAREAARRRALMNR